MLDRGPGTTAQYLHRDELVWVHLPAPHPTIQLATMVALVDFTAENGATMVVPGSHRGHGHEGSDDAGGAGRDVSRIGGDLPRLHAARRRSQPDGDQWRRGLHVSYVVGWLRTEENHYLTTWPKVAHELPEASQRLLGYAAHDAINLAGGYLGAVELQDPVQLMADGQL